MCSLFMLNDKMVIIFLTAIVFYSNTAIIHILISSVHLDAKEWTATSSLWFRMTKK